jgi:hypothetical protein
MSRQKTPFHALVDHFVKRLSASEEEQGSGGMGLGLGAVLAILASPGAFASIFLLGKYSTLLQWIRGQYFDPIQRSPSDEYFFVILSMTITGMVMVARWNRLFPDRRDFSNLAPLPIPIRNIFLANFVALLGLAMLFGVDVNIVSALLFPFFVTIGIGTASAFWRVAVAHALTVFSSSLFSFFAAFALVGTLMLIIPKRFFRPISVFMRMCLVVLLLTEFFSNIFVQLFAGRLPGGPQGYLRFLPSYWFLGVYETLVGIAKPHMRLMGQQALIALAIAVIVSLTAYTLCYRRIFVRLPESFDTMGSRRSFFRIRFPETLLRPLFRSPFERATITFGCKVLLRSEQHLMFFGAYLGIGLVIVVQSVLDSASVRSPSALPDASWLAVPFLVAFFVVSGLRFVFDRPAVLDANWVFRVSFEFPDPHPRAAAKKLMLWATLPWQLLVLLPISVERLGWTLALLHVATVISFAVLFADVILLPFRKIPFTCANQLDIKQMLAQMIGWILAVLVIVPAIAGVERWLLQAPPRFVALAAALAVAWYWLARQRHANEESESVVFEDGPGPMFELLKLT